MHAGRLRKRGVESLRRAHILKARRRRTETRIPQHPRASRTTRTVAKMTQTSVAREMRDA